MLFLTTSLAIFYCLPLLTWAKPFGLSIETTNMKQDVLDLFEGDIAGIDGLDILNGHEPKNALVYEEMLWPNAIVFYTISADFNETELKIISQAMMEYEIKSCIRFVLRTNQPDFVAIQKTGKGYIGRTGAEQVLSLDSSCFNGGLPGTPIHELMHAVGFFHEQSRTDRDDYVIINYPNIQPGTENNFLAYGPDVLQYLGASYDYGSVMHYGAYSFPIDPTIPTIITRQPGVEIGQRRGFSEVDLFKLNALYKCTSVRKTE